MYIPVNYLAVFVVAVAQMVLGFLWYGPVFGKMWATLMGFSEEKMKEMKAKGGAGKSYALMALGALVMSCVLAHFVVYAGALDFMGGMNVGAWLWLGFIAPVMLGSVLWESKPWKLYFLNVSYYLVTLVLAGGILAIWQ